MLDDLKNPVAWAVLAVFTLVLLVGIVKFVGDVAEIGKCGYGPAAPRSVCFDPEYVVDAGATR